MEVNDLNSFNRFNEAIVSWILYGADQKVPGLICMIF